MNIMMRNLVHLWFEPLRSHICVMSMVWTEEGIFLGVTYSEKYKSYHAIYWAPPNLMPAKEKILFHSVKDFFFINLIYLILRSCFNCLEFLWPIFNFSLLITMFKKWCLFFCLEWLSKFVYILCLSHWTRLHKNVDQPAWNA